MSNPLLEYFGNKLRYELIYPDETKKHVFPVASPYGTFEAVKKSIELSNKAGYGVFFTINEFANPKHRLKEEFKSARAVWIEDDDGKCKLADFPLPPSCVVQSSPGKHHYYWFTSCDDMDEWDAVIRGMCEKYQGDPGGIKVTQILRVPGFKNTKYDDPHLVAIEGGNFKKYSWYEVTKHFPPMEIVKHEHPTEDNIVNRKAVLDIKHAVSDILTGESIYPNMIRLAASYAAKNYNRKDIYSNIKPLLELSQADPTRIKNAEDKLWMCIDDARAKYAKDRAKGRFRDTVEEQLHCVLEFPPGFAGVVARHVYSTMFLGSREIAIATALHALSVLCCGGYHWNRVPVNRKRLILANNGVGKQVTDDYFKKLIKHLPQPGLLDLFSSENSFSASNLQHDLNIHKCRSIIIGEAGKIASSMAGDKGTLQAQRLKLLASKIYGAAVSTTAYSKAKASPLNTVKLEAVQDPIVSILEESTPQTYVETFHNTRQADSGELARTDIYFIKEPDSSEVNWCDDDVEFPEEIVNRVNELVMNYMDMDVMDGTKEHVSEKHIEVDYSDVDHLAKDMFLKYMDLRPKVDNLERSLIVRLHERVWTTCVILATCDATGRVPKVTVEHWDYAVKLHEELNRSSLANLRGGHLANSMEQTLRQVRQKLAQDPDPDSHLLNNGNITRQWLKRKVRPDESKFTNLKAELPYSTNDKIYTAIINNAIDDGIIEKVPGKVDQWFNLIKESKK